MGRRVAMAGGWVNTQFQENLEGGKGGNEGEMGKREEKEGKGWKGEGGEGISGGRKLRVGSQKCASV